MAALATRTVRKADLVADVLYSNLLDGDIERWDAASGKWKNVPLPTAPDLSGYVLQLGRAGGQQVAGGTDGTQGLTLRGTSHATATTTVTTETGTAIWRTGADKASLAEAMRLNSSGYLGIGTNNPGTALHIAHPTNWVITDTCVSDTGFPTIQQVRARGVPGSPAIVANGDIAAIWRSYAYDGAANQYLADIRAIVGGAPSAGVMPGALTFLTNAGGTTLTERMRLTAAGRLGLGTTGPTAFLHVIDTGSNSLALDSYGAPGRAQVFLRSSRGSLATPAAVTSGDLLMQQQVQGHDGTAFRDSCLLRVNATGAPTATGVPSNLEVYVNNGSSNQLVTRFLSSRHILFNVTAAPADADLLNSTFALWLDPTVGATKVMIKAKDSAGTVRTGSIALA